MKKIQPKVTAKAKTKSTKEKHVFEVHYCLTFNDEGDEVVSISPAKIKAQGVSGKVIILSMATICKAVITALLKNAPSGAKYPDKKQLTVRLCTLLAKEYLD